jgi:CRISPR system Cascade subunit CasA
VLCNGDRLTSQNRHQLDPHTSWRYSEPQTKKAKTTVYMPKLHQPGRSIWRGLAALLPAEAGRRAGQEPQPALAPGVLEWIASLNGFGVLPAGYRAQVTAIGARYENNDAIITEVIRDRLDIAVALLRQDDAALGQAACDAAADAEKVAMALWQLAENIARAAGAEPKKGAGDRARERAYAEFDRPFRTWLSGLRPGSDGLAARTEWQQQLLRLTQPVVKEIVAAASPAAWRGRPVNGRDINVPVAELWFRRALRKALPTAFETAGDVKDKELV